MRPRIRSIKPEIWQDERIGELSHGARLLFVGLITMADDEGRLRELPAAILGHIFPYDDVSTNKLSRWLGEVAATGMVIRYESGARRYVAFRHWTRHQKVDKPNDSELPPPPNSPNGSPNGSGNDRGSIPESVGDGSRPLRTRDSDPILSDPVSASNKSKRSFQEDARTLFGFWQGECRHPDAKYTDERRRKIEARLAESYTFDQIRMAILGAARNAFVNDDGKRFDDIELICRNGSKLESFIDRASSVPRPAAAVSKVAALHRKLNQADSLRLVESTVIEERSA